MIQQLFKFDLSKFSLREKMIAAAAFAAIFYFLFYQTLYLSKANEVSNLRNEIAAINKEITAITQQLPEAAKKVDELKRLKPSGKNSDGRNESIGDTTKLSSLLEEFTKLARGIRVDFVSIRPILVEDKGRYLELKLSIELRARYHQLGEYIKALEDLPRGVVINNVRIESDPSLSPLSTSRIDALAFILKE